MVAATRPRAGLLPETLQYVAGLDPLLAGVTAGGPESSGWYRVDELAADVVGPWVDELAASNGDHRDVAGSFLGGWLASAVVTIPVVSLVVLDRSPQVTRTMSVHRHADGWFDGVAFDAPAVHVFAGGAGDDDAHAVGHRCVDDLLDVVAHELVDLLAPLLATVRAVAPFGLRGLWGGVADDISATVTWAARLAGRGQREARLLGEALVDRIAGRVPPLRARPRPFPVRWSGGEDLFQVKGTCCLSHKTGCETVAEQGPQMCTTCPFRDDGDRGSRLVAYLESGGR